MTPQHCLVAPGVPSLGTGSQNMTGRPAGRLGSDLLSLGFLGVCVSGLVAAYVHDSLTPAETRAAFADIVTTAWVDPLTARGYATWGTHTIAYGVAERPSALLQQALPVPRLPLQTALINGHGGHAFALPASGTPGVKAPSVAKPMAVAAAPVAVKPVAAVTAEAHSAVQTVAPVAFAATPALPVSSRGAPIPALPTTVLAEAALHLSPAPVTGAHRTAVAVPAEVASVAPVVTPAAVIAPAAPEAAPKAVAMTQTAATTQAHTASAMVATRPATAAPPLAHAAINPTPLAVDSFVAPLAPTPMVKISFTPATAMPTNTMEDSAEPATPTRSSSTTTTRHLPYGLAAVRDGSSGVPRVFLPAVPSELGSIQDSDARKVIFLQTMLPLVLVVNEQIAADRHRLEGILERQRNGHPPSAADARWMQAKADYYGLDSVQPVPLLARMDIVPPSLALAQAAIESGWGTSRLARKHNALFGQGKPDGSKHGPKDAAGHPVKAFPTLLAAVQSYVHNLNTHQAYSAFRATRAEMRRTGKTIAGNRLAATLTAYSELGDDYTGSIRSTIAANDLAGYDTAWLTTEPKFNRISDVSDR